MGKDKADANPVPMLACVVDLIAGDRKRPIASDEFDLYRE